MALRLEVNKLYTISYKKNGFSKLVFTNGSQQIVFIFESRVFQQRYW